MLEHRRSLTALFASASLVAISTPAYGQRAMPAADDSAQVASAPPASPQHVAPADDIVVTGSRTIKNGDNSPTPVTVVSTETLQNVRPTSLTESLNVMPVFSGSRGQVSNPSATGAVGGGNGTASQLNLRNIGVQRNLVLMDGRRVPPTSFTNIVDADVIPQLLIKRVDVVTGGVSAVYGSDAVTGVINFITDTTFSGLKVQMQGGVSQQGDDGSEELGVAWGVKIGDRSHFEVSYEYRNDDGIGRRSDRSWFNRATVVGNGGTIPYHSIINSTVSTQPFGGRITCSGACAITGQYFATDGVLSPFVNGTVYAGTTTQSGGAGGYLDTSLKASQESHQVFARFDTELTDNIKFFVSGSANFKKNVFYGDDMTLSGYTLSKTNAFLPAVYQAQIPAATFTYNQTFAQDARLKQAPNTRQLSFVAGLEGKAANFSWGLAYVHGESHLTTDLYNNINQQKLSAALDAVTNGAGQTVCYAATQAATAAAYANCVPLNVFGPTASSAAARAYVFDQTHYVADTKQDDVTANIGGSPFSTWAGEVNVALSGEWRRQSFKSTSNGTPTMLADCTSLRFNCVSTGAGTLLLRNSFAASPLVSQAVWEVAGEATVPLIKDLPLIKSFEINAAVRYTSYQRIGNYTTWKLGGTWVVNNDLRIRGTLSRDIRAPTLSDLYAPGAFSVDNIQDLKNNVTLPGTTQNIANPNLTAEIGNTKTVGLVYKPSYLPGVSVAIDYYKIDINNAIVSVQGAQASIQNGCNITGVALYCNLIQRDSTGKIVNVITTPINLAKITTAGVDFELNYQGALFGHRMNLRGLAAYQPHIRYIQPALPTIDQGGVAFGTAGLQASPAWRVTGVASFEVTDNVRVDILERWRSSLKLTGDPSLAFVAGDNRIRPNAQTSLNLAFTVRKDSEIFFNVQNLFNIAPPTGNMPGSATSPGHFGGFAITDDVVGRYFVAGARLKF